MFRFVEREKANYPVATMCRVLGVSTSGYYAWRSRLASPRSLADACLTEVIRKIHKESRGTYGAPRIHADLRLGHRIFCSQKRVARLMRQAGIQGIHRRRRAKTTRPEKTAAPAPDLLRRDFGATWPDQKWIADITYVPTWAGFLYLAVVLDCFSRRVVGWCMRDDLTTQLVLDALEMAIHNRRPGKGLIHHSDRGCQYTSYVFGRRCREAGIIPSMGSVGDAYDNAAAESFFATLECELIDRTSFRNRTEARTAIFDFIEAFYNRQRRHSSIQMLSPAEFERMHRGAEVAETGSDRPALRTAGDLEMALRGAQRLVLDRPTMIDQSVVVRSTEQPSTAGSLTEGRWEKEPTIAKRSTVHGTG